MDTDDLSRETYDGILMEAERLTHDLTLHFGVLASDCKDEFDYIEKAKLLIKEIRDSDDEDLYDIFWGNPPDKKELYRTFDNILKNIEEVEAIPIEKRKFDF